jgi:IrrE N-terminal-like domain
MSPLSDASRAACLQHLQDVEYCVDFAQIATIEDLCAAIATVRGRPIVLEAYPMPRKLDGCWIASETTDYLLYAADADPVAQEHAIAHELAHVLLAHSLAQIDLAGLFPGGDFTPVPSIVRRLRAETAHPQDTPAEQEAEFLAMLLEERLAQSRFPDDPVIWSGLH